MVFGHCDCASGMEVHLSWMSTKAGRFTRVRGPEGPAETQLLEGFLVM